ncbi:hypothetical protein GOV13_04280 [Candidatus Pacearchaeota archaeon]|nr:hypothetical protein [Candidatus Pacearchaeota archaeon]
MGRKCAECNKKIGMFSIDNKWKGNLFCSDSCKLKFKKNFLENEKKALVEFKGRNGRISLFEKFVRFDRENIMGFLMQGLKGKKDIYFKNITSIQVKKPGITVGYLQFSLPGGNESKRGVFGSLHDENTISFDGKEKYNKALKIKEYIEDNIHKNPKRNLVSDSDEIEKMYKLMEKGIITKKEFEQKKKKILG